MKKTKTRKHRTPKPKVKQFSGSWFRENTEKMKTNRETSRKNIFTKAEYESF